jgi:hypothetical protein
VGAGGQALNATMRAVRMLAAWAALAWAQATVAAQTFTLPASAQATMSDAARLQEFAGRAATEVERLLAAEAAPADEKLGLLLALRVHLALLRRDGARALDTAERIRARQPSPAERAFAGLTTQATVAAWAAPRAGEAAAFAAEFRRLLAALPRSPEMAAVLTRQRERLEAMTEPALRAEAARLAAVIGDRRQVTLAEVDQIVRVGHRLEHLAPRREAMIAALDEAR